MGSCVGVYSVSSPRIGQSDCFKVVIAVEANHFLFSRTLSNKNGSSYGVGMDIDISYLSWALLVFAVLIVCSVKGFACLSDNWFLHKGVSPSLR